MKKLKRQWQYHLMLLPGVILIFIFAYIPLYGVIIAFEDYNPALGFSSPWVGLKKFRIYFQPAGFPENNLEHVLYCGGKADRRNCRTGFLRTAAQ